MDKHPNINTTIRLPRQVHGGFPLLLSTKLANLVIAAIEGVLNLKINVPTTDGTNILQTLQALVVQGDLGLEVTMPPQGLPGAGGSPSPSSNIQIAYVVADLGSTLTCATTDPSLGGTLVYISVIKPYFLQCGVGSYYYQGVEYDCAYTIPGLIDVNNPVGSPGMSYPTRTVSVSGNTIETDNIDPPYIWGYPIMVLQIGSYFYDMNQDGRAWAAQ